VRHPLSTFGAAGATNAAVFAFVLVNGVLMARLLGPSGRGTVFMTVALPTAAAALVGSWVYPVLVRRAAAEGASLRRLNALCLRATVPLAVVTALLSWLLIALAGRQLDGPARWTAVVYAALWSPLSLLILNFQAHDLGRARWRRYNVLRLLPYPVILAGLLACFLLGRRDPGGVLLVLLASNLPPAVARLWLARRDGGSEQVDPAEVDGLYREALPFLAASGGTAALTYADQVVAAALLAPAEAGLYAVAQRMSLLLAPLSTAAGAVSLSEAARPAAAAPAGLAWRGRVVAVLAGAFLALAPAVWFLVPVLYGREFTGARVAGLLALGAGVLAALADFREQRLEGAGRPLRALPGRAGGALALVALAVPAGLRWGPAGIAAGSVVGQCVRGLLLNRFEKRAA
jgi:O-antigen/teichoic acid export membrane protein